MHYKLHYKEKDNIILVVDKSKRNKDNIIKIILIKINNNNNKNKINNKWKEEYLEMINKINNLLDIIIKRIIIKNK